MHDTLLQRRDAQRADERLRLWEETREKLRRALGELLPGERVIVFGSIVQRGRFNAASDIDLALFHEPCDRSIFSLQAALEERMQRPVDLVVLPEIRFAEKIIQEGDEWTL